MSFTTVISPSTAIDRIIASGYCPLQFISRAYRDRSYEWAVRFEAEAYLNDCLGYAMTARETYDRVSQDVEMERVLWVAERTPWIYNNHPQWLNELRYLTYCDDCNVELESAELDEEPPFDGEGDDDDLDDIKYECIVNYCRGAFYAKITPADALEIMQAKDWDMQEVFSILDNDYYNSDISDDESFRYWTLAMQDRAEYALF